jgi:hypothetical protein
VPAPAAAEPARGTSAPDRPRPAGARPTDEELAAQFEGLDKGQLRSAYEQRLFIVDHYNPEREVVGDEETPLSLEEFELVQRELSLLKDLVDP